MRRTAVIGAGISGLYLAWKLAEKGENVVVFERKKTIGKQVCSGLFSDRILDFIPESKSLIQNQINSVLIHFPKRTIKVEFSKKFLVMSHFELDNLVARLAEKAGAKINLNCDISQLDFNIFRNEAELDRRRGLRPRLDLRPALQGLVFDRIIGCDGPNSVVRESLGLPAPNYRLAIQGFVQKKDNSDYVETWSIKNGFIWKIPRGKKSMKFPSSPSSLSRAIAEGEEESLLSLPSLRESSITEYGIIGNPKKTKEIFDEFLKKNNLQLERLESALVPQGFLIPFNPKITLCGDAAGLTKPWSGGGVIWGLTAANILLKNFPDFLRYKNGMKKFFLPKIAFSKIATKAVYFLGFKMPWLLPGNYKIESDFLL